MANLKPVDQLHPTEPDPLVDFLTVLDLATAHAQAGHADAAVDAITWLHRHFLDDGGDSDDGGGSGVRTALERAAYHYSLNYLSGFITGADVAVLARVDGLRRTIRRRLREELLPVSPAAGRPVVVALVDAFEHAGRTGPISLEEGV